MLFCVHVALMMTCNDGNMIFKTGTWHQVEKICHHCHTLLLIHSLFVGHSGYCQYLILLLPMVGWLVNNELKRIYITMIMIKSQQFVSSYWGKYIKPHSGQLRFRLDKWNEHTLQGNFIINLSLFDKCKQLCLFNVNMTCFQIPFGVKCWFTLHRPMACAC